MAAASGGLIAASTIEIDEFLNGALVSWVESCLTQDHVICGYASLLDGQIIHNVWLQIDPEPQHSIIDVNNLNGAALCSARTKNYESILRNLKQLFEEEFRQTILTLPECHTLGYYPDSKQGLEQMKLLLTLLLGAAVQCPNKEHFIARIKQLDVDTQHAIVELIKQVTDNQSLVLTEESVELLSPVNMYNHISCLTKERDAIYLKWISVICKEPELNTSANDDGVHVSPLTNGLTFTHPSSSFDNNHLAVELADLKSKLRKLRQELFSKGFPTIFYYINKILRKTLSADIASCLRLLKAVKYFQLFVNNNFRKFLINFYIFEQYERLVTWRQGCLQILL